MEKGIRGQEALGEENNNIKLLGQGLKTGTIHCRHQKKISLNSSGFTFMQISIDTMADHG